MAEQWTENPRVGGSIPPLATIPNSEVLAYIVGCHSRNSITTPITYRHQGLSPMAVDDRKHFLNVGSTSLTQHARKIFGICDSAWGLVSYTAFFCSNSSPALDIVLLCGSTSPCLLHTCINPRVQHFSAAPPLPHLASFGRVEPKQLRCSFLSSLNRSEVFFYWHF